MNVIECTHYVFIPFSKNKQITNKYFILTNMTLVLEAILLSVVCLYSSILTLPSQAHGAWISFPPPPFSLLPSLFSKFSYKSFLFQNLSVEKLWTQNTRIIHDVWRLLILSNEEKTNDYENFEKGMIYVKILRKGGRRKRNPCPMRLWLPYTFLYLIHVNGIHHLKKIN